jgi:hypothetical protein
VLAAGRQLHAMQGRTGSAAAAAVVVRHYILCRGKCFSLKKGANTVPAQVFPPPARGRVGLGAVPRLCLQVRAGKPAFLKKSGKKLLIILASACPDRLSHVLQKFFGSFFRKRTAF